MSEQQETQTLGQRVDIIEKRMTIADVDYTKLQARVAELEKLVQGLLTNHYDNWKNVFKKQSPNFEENKEVKELFSERMNSNITQAVDQIGYVLGAKLLKQETSKSS
jgi:hypothetical protein